MGRGLPLTLPGRDLALGRSGLEPAARALAARFGEDWRSLACFSSLRGAQSFTYPGRGTPVGEQDRRSCLYHILPQTTGKKELCSENPSGSSDSGCFRSPELPGQSERRPPSPGPHPGSCLFPTKEASWRNLPLNILLGQL